MFCNEIILDGLSRHDPAVINQVYIENQQIITRWIKKNNGNEDDVVDLLHDALLIILRKSKEEQINLTCSFSTYMVSVCKHLWFQELRRRQRLILTDITQYIDIPVEEFDNSFQLKYKLYNKILNTLEIKERQLLILYNQKKPLTEIMKLLDFKNKQAVADKKKN